MNRTFLPNSRSQHCPQKKVSLWTIGSATVNIGVNCGVDCWWWCLLSIAQQKEGLHELRRLAWCEQTLEVGPLFLSYNMLIQLKKQCLGLLSLWQCFPLPGILWRKLLLSLQTKSPAVWTIGRAFVFRSGSRYDKVFSNISHSNIIKERIHWYSLKKLAAHLYSGVGHTLLGLAKWLYLVCNWMVPWSLEVVHLLSLCLWKGISCSRRVLVKLLLPISPKSSFHFLEENISWKTI